MLATSRTPIPAAPCVRARTLQRDFFSPSLRGRAHGATAATHLLLARVASIEAATHWYEMNSGQNGDSGKVDPRPTLPHPPRLPEPPASTSMGKTAALLRLEEAQRKFPQIVIGELVVQQHSHEFNIEAETLSRPCTPTESKRLLQFLNLAFTSTDWFTSSKVTNIQAFKNIGWSMHCYDPAIQFIDPNQLNKRANHLKKLYKDVLQTLHNNGIEHYMDEAGRWVGEVDEDGSPILRSKNNKRRRLEFFLQSHKIQRWAESVSVRPESPSSLALLGKDTKKSRRMSVESAKKRARTGESYLELMNKLMDMMSAAEGSDGVPTNNLPDYVAMWNSEDVYRWATATVELSMEDAQAMNHQHIDGRGLMVLANGGERRIRDIPGMSYNGFLRLVDALLERPSTYFQEPQATPQPEPLNQLLAHPGHGGHAGQLPEVSGSRE